MTEEGDEDDCKICHRTMGTRDGCEPTEICDTCAQDRVVRLDDARERTARRLWAFRDELRRLRAEVRKQVNGSNVVFDREIVERAEKRQEYRW